LLKHVIPVYWCEKPSAFQSCLFSKYDVTVRKQVVAALQPQPRCQPQEQRPPLIEDEGDGIARPVLPPPAAAPLICHVYLRRAIAYYQVFPLRRELRRLTAGTVSVFADYF
jgi:hypothetical protein